MQKKIAVVGLVILAFLVAYHQFANYSIWFELEDLHHETWIIALICLALGIIFSEKLEGTLDFSTKNN